MSITLTQQTETRIQEKAKREGRDVNAIADALISSVLDWEAQERSETLEGIRRGDQAAEEGRERPLQEFLSEQRSKHGFAKEWPNSLTESQDEHVA